jgi:homoserine kinase
VSPEVSGLVTQRVVVEAPASTANLGAGYDALALAVDLVDRVELAATDAPGLSIEVQGEGNAELSRGPDNRFVVALETGLRWALGELPDGVGWNIRMRNDIPLLRGLGSSAAATVAGLVAANALAGDRLDERKLLDLAIQLEGHPDNVAAALLGGFVVVVAEDGHAEAVRFDPAARLRCVFFVPELELSTARMRQVLPAEVPHRDAVFNLGRAALAVAAIASGRSELLRIATEDRLHQPYRSEVFPALPALIGAAREAGAMGACLSGAGSTVVAFVDTPEMAAAVEAAFESAARVADLRGAIQVLAPRRAGAVVVETD